MKKQLLFLSILLSTLLTNPETGPEKLLRILSTISSGGVARLPETPVKAPKESKGDPSGSDSGKIPPPPPMKLNPDGTFLSLPGTQATTRTTRPAPAPIKKTNPKGGGSLAEQLRQAKLKSTKQRKKATPKSITFTIGIEDDFAQGIIGTTSLKLKERNISISGGEYTIVKKTEGNVETVTFTLEPGYKWTDINSATAEQIDNDDDDSDDSDDDDDDDYVPPTMTPEEIAEAERLRKDAEEAQLKADAEEQVAEKLRLEAIVSEEKIQSQEVRAWAANIIRQATALLQNRKEPGTDPQFSQEQLIAFLQELSASEHHKVPFNRKLSSTLGGMQRKEYKEFQTAVWKFAFAGFMVNMEAITSPTVSEQNVRDYLNLWINRSNKITHKNKTSPEQFKSMPLASYKEFRTAFEKIISENDNTQQIIGVLLADDNQQTDAELALQAIIAKEKAAAVVKEKPKASNSTASAAPSTRPNMVNVLAGKEKGKFSERKKTGKQKKQAKSTSLQTTMQKQMALLYDSDEEEDDENLGCWGCDDDDDEW